MYGSACSTVEIRYKMTQSKNEHADKPVWGLLGPETLESSRRTRTLDVAAVVRRFNDLAVPGMGGVWFGKQLMWATLGIAVAERLRDAGMRVQNIETANAVEALSCWMALKGNSRQQDPRIRGREKLDLNGDSEMLAFARMRKPGFYVTQPMRMATVQPLRALGLVDTEADSERFNSYRCSTAGQEFLELALNPTGPVFHGRNVFEHLVDWASGQRVGIAWRNSGLRDALSPTTPLAAAARAHLMDRLRGAGEDSARRAAALSWAESLRHSERSASWSERPHGIEEAHWADLHQGALFFAARDATLELLDLTEASIGNTQQSLSLSERLPVTISTAAQNVRNRCALFLSQLRDPTAQALASDFCRSLSVESDAELLREAVRRDGRVLRLRDDMVVPGAAFQGSGVSAGADADGDLQADMSEAGVTAPFDARSAWPDDASPRLHRLFQMNLDLQGHLGAWLVAGRAEAVA